MKRIANECNKYFVSIGHSLASSNTNINVNPMTYLVRNSNSMVIHEIPQTDIILVIQSLKISSPGWDDVPISIAKKIINV